jgi:S1-C subfamily serine protease
MAKSITDQLVANGKVSRGMLGIKGSEVTEELAKNFDYPKTTGAFINEVLKDSAADDAGLEAGDIITEIDDVEIKNFAQLRAKIATLGANKTVKLKIFRDGQYKTIKVKLAASEDNKISDNDEDLAIFNGIILENNGDSTGLVVKNIDPKVPNKFGLKQGDIILVVNRININSINDLRKAVSKSKNFISLYIKRGDSNIYITQNI